MTTDEIKTAPGQILPGTPLGDVLTLLASESETIVEIGTWNGRGSTMCLRLGLRRPSQRIWTVETNPDMHAAASEFHKDEPRITCLLGTVVSGDEIIPFSGQPDRRADYDCEIAENNKSPRVINALPDTISLLFVDGGAFSGFAEVRKLMDRCEKIALDDTSEEKNSKSYLLLNYSKWNLRLSGKDRNGWAVFDRV